MEKGLQRYGVLMTKDETREAIKVMQAYVDGAEIEMKLSSGWIQATTPFWDWSNTEWRIKKTPRTFWVDLYGDGRANMYTARDDAPPGSYAGLIKMQEVIE